MYSRYRYRKSFDSIWDSKGFQSNGMERCQSFTEERNISGSATELDCDVVDSRSVEVSIKNTGPDGLVTYFQELLNSYFDDCVSFKECWLFLKNICQYPDIRHSLPWCSLIPLCEIDLIPFGNGNVLSTMELCKVEDQADVIHSILRVVTKYMSPAIESSEPRTNLPLASCTDDIQETLLSTATTSPTRHLNSFPRLPWRPSRENVGDGASIDTRHFGQRKLLLMEIEFLTRYSEDNDTLVYCGAAPGQHIILLAAVLFPRLQYRLYDPAPFAWNPADFNLANVVMHQKMFDNEEAEKLKHEWDANSNNEHNNLLFISDIRRLQEDEDLVADDMNLQEHWCNILQPHAAMLKFRLRYGIGETIYLQGEVRLQPYTGHRSTEARLIVVTSSKDVSSPDSNKDAITLSNNSNSCAIIRSVATISGTGSPGIINQQPLPDCVYNNLIYEERFFYFNTVHRLAEYKHLAYVGIHPCNHDKYYSSNETTPTDTTTDSPTRFSPYDSSYSGLVVEALPMTWDGAVESDILYKYIVKLWQQEHSQHALHPKVSSNVIILLLKYWMQFSCRYYNILLPTDVMETLLFHPKHDDVVVYPDGIAPSSHQESMFHVEGLVVGSLSLWIYDCLKTYSVAMKESHKHLQRLCYLDSINDNKKKRRRKRARK